MDILGAQAHDEIIRKVDRILSKVRTLDESFQEFINEKISEEKPPKNLMQWRIQALGKLDRTASQLDELITHIELFLKSSDLPFQGATKDILNTLKKIREGIHNPL